MIEVFTTGGPSPRKVTVMLEELGWEYDWHFVNVYGGAQTDPKFLAMNPNGRLPALIDHGAEGGKLLLWESMAILLYLAEKSGQFLPASGAARYNVLQWASFQATHAPYLGNAHYFRVVIPETEPYAIDRFARESTRIYKLLDGQLASHEYIAGHDYSIADISLFPWIEYREWQSQNLADYPNLARWFNQVGARPAVERGRSIPYPHTEYGDSPEGKMFGQLTAQRLADPARKPSWLQTA